MPDPIRGEEIAQLIESRIEDDTIQNGIIEVLRLHNSKPLTKRHIDELKEKVDGSISISKRFDMTHIEWGEYSRTGGNQGGSLLISNQTTHVKIDTVDIIGKNPAYFEALKERNQKRHEILGKPFQMELLGNRIRNFIRAKELLDRSLDFDGDFGTDRHTIMEKYKLTNG